MNDDGQHIEPFIPLRLLHLSEEKKSPQKKNKTLLLGAWHTRSLHSLNGAPDRRPSKSAVESKRVVKEKSGSKVSEKGKVEEEEGTRLFLIDHRPERKKSEKKSEKSFSLQRRVQVGPLFPLTARTHRLVSD